MKLNNYNRSYTPRAFIRGVTLLELMTVLSVVGIMLSVALPSMKGITANNEASRLINELKLDISFARSQAVSLSDTVQVIPITNWSNGWRVVQGGVTELRARGSAANPIADSGTIRSTDFSTTVPITFDANGRATNTGTLTLLVADCIGNKNFTLSINQIGQIIVSEAACPL